MNIKSFLLPFLLGVILANTSLPSSAQKNEHFWELYLCSDFIYQSYDENTILSATPTIVHKRTSIGIIETLGLGAQYGVITQKNLIASIGSAIKYTSAEMGLGISYSSDLGWIRVASEDLLMLQLGIPISVYYHNDRPERKFSLRPGLSFEPNILLYHKSSLRVHHPNFYQVADPESSPRHFTGVFSVNFKGAYVIDNNDELFCELRIHNTQILLKEELTEHSLLPVGMMIILGYKF